MLGETFILIRPFLRRLGWTVLLAVSLGYVTGSILTLKSEIEAGIIEQVDLALNGEGEAGELYGQLQRFSDPQTSPELPFPLQAIKLTDLTLWPALGIYGFVAVLGVCIGVVVTASRMKAKRTVYAAFLRHGVRSALLSQSRENPELKNLPGHYASAIQLGANTLSTTYSYAIQGLQQLITLVVAIAAIRQQTSIWFVATVVTMCAAQALLSVVRARRLSDRRNDLDDRRNSLWAKVDDTLAMRDVLVAYEQHEAYVDKLGNQSLEYVAVEGRLERSETCYEGGSSLATDAGRIALLFLAILILPEAVPDQVSGVGDAYFLVSIYGRLLFPTSDLLSQFDAFKRSHSEAATYLKLVAQPQITSANDGDLWPPSPRGALAVTFRHVHIKYPGQESGYALDDCSFTIPAKQTTLILGRSGYGKTTIARAVLGFIGPDKGTIEVWERPIGTISGGKLRAEMSYLSQDNHVIDDSIRENLSWGLSDHDITPERMVEALDQVGLREIDINMSAKTLSTGQQQRVALARMMLDKSEMLILDEPLSGADLFTFGDLIAPLRELLVESNRTVIIISHRLSFATWAKHVVLLGRKGQVTEEGPPRELLNSNGDFAALYSTAQKEILLQ